jgi:CrcB protein
MISLMGLTAVAVGGAFGSALRYCVGVFSLHHFPGSELPLGTIAVNLIGCFLIGALVEFSARHDFLNKDLQLLLVTGFLGGFTTFSAFGLETMSLANRSLFLATVNILLSVVGGLLSVGLGMRLVRMLL